MGRIKINNKFSSWLEYSKCSPHEKFDEDIQSGKITQKDLDDLYEKTKLLSREEFNKKYIEEK